MPRSQGRITRRRMLHSAAATGAVGLSATILPAAWRTAFAVALLAVVAGYLVYRRMSRTDPTQDDRSIGAFAGEL